VREALDLIAESGGEIWAKLDAGTLLYYEQIDRSRVPFQTIIDNITNAAKRSPIIIQTLFLKMHGEPIPEEELCAYIGQLKTITQQGGQIKLVQFYTIARATAEPWVTPLDDQELDAAANRVRNETGLPVETFYG
jgi:wyosine [tRNA(Phe)-imidazoG37] synthetase (radical SAM superfamily)